MQIAIEIPDEVAQRLNEEWGSLSHRLLEVFVAQAYGSGALSTSEVRRILQLPSRREEPDRILYLAVPDLIYNSFFQLDFPASILQENSVKIIVYDIELEQISQWKD